jgi:DNA-binding NarL/FixJ family response regulator
MRILLADDQSKIRFGLRLLLEREPDLDVVGEAAEAETLLAQLETIQPDVVLLDWELPGLAVIGGLPALRTICPQLLVIALSGRLEARRAALAAGADAFVSKSKPPSQLLATLRAISQSRG